MVAPMRTGSIRASCMAILAALVGAACTRSCDSPRLGRTERASAPDASETRRVLDYAAFMKASPAGTVANLARHLGVELAPTFEEGGASPRRGDGNDVYAVANGGLIKVTVDRSHQPLVLNYRGPVGCPSTRGQGEAKTIAPADANAQVLALLRLMGLPVDDKLVVESQLHQDGQIWLGVHVWQSYRGEVVQLPSIFVVVDGMNRQVCEMRIPRWHVGLDRLGPPLPNDALTDSARMHGPRLLGVREIGAPALRSLRIVRDTLCREVRFPGSPDPLCLDVVTGAPVPGPW